MKYLIILLNGKIMCHRLDVWLIIFSSKLKFNLMNHSSEFGYKYFLTDEVYFIILAYT